MKKKFTRAALIAVLAMIGNYSRAQSVITFVGNSSSNDINWDSAYNWDLHRKPQSGDTIIIPNGLSVEVTQSYNNLADVVIKVKPRAILYIGTSAMNGSLLLTGNSVVSLESVPGQAGAVIRSGGFRRSSNIIQINNDIKFQGNLSYPIGGRGQVNGPARADKTTGTGINGFVPGALPVVLSNFEAIVVNGKKVSLAWTTQQEINSNYFSIERSADGTNWKEMIIIRAAGNSSLPINYSATDDLPLKGANLYRLRMIDLDGTFSFSAVKMIIVNEASIISVYPNPASGVINITTGNIPATNWNVRLLSLSGQELIKKEINKGITTATISSVGMPNGLYLIVINDGVNSETSKIFIAH